MADKIDMDLYFHNYTFPFGSHNFSITNSTDNLPYRLFSSRYFYVFWVIFYVSFHGIKQYNVADYYGEKMAPADISSKINAAPEIPDANALIKYKTSTLSDGSETAAHF